MKQHTKSSILIIMAGFFWGIIGPFTKAMSECGFNPQQITFVRMLVAEILFAIYLLIFDRKKFRFDIKDIWMFLGTGLFSIYFHNVTFFHASINGESSIASVLVNTSPVFIMLASAILFHEKITIRKLVALALTMCGCVFVSGVIQGNSSVRPAIILIGIASGFLYGMYTIFSRFALEKYSHETINMYTYLFAFTGGLFAVNVPQTVSLMFASTSNLLHCILTGTVPCLIPFLLYTAGLEHVENSKAAILVALDPIVATLTGIFILQESSSFFKLAGIVLIVSSIVVLNTGKHRLNT